MRSATVTSASPGPAAAAAAGASSSVSVDFSHPQDTPNKHSLPSSSCFRSSLLIPTSQILTLLSTSRAWHNLLIYLIVPTFTLFYWRGTWLLCDHYLYPNSTTSSGLASLIIGYVGLFLFFLMQYAGYIGHDYSSLIPSKSTQLCSNHSFLFYLTYFESYYIAFCVVNSWRGLWLLQDVYLMPSQPVLSSWISHLLGVIILIIFHHFKSVYAPPAVYFTDYEFQCTRLNCLSSYDKDDLVENEEKDEVSMMEEYSRSDDVPPRYASSNKINGRTNLEMEPV